MASENYFELFGLPVQFAVDAATLEETWRQLAARVHPDRYATATQVERRVAMQWASTVNDAYRTLKSPLSRARYLCEQAGCDLQTESNTAMNSAFLLQQMEWREQLDEARSGNQQELDALQQSLETSHREITSEVARLIDRDRDYRQAALKVREWMFLDKLSQEVQSVRHQLADRQH